MIGKEKLKTENRKIFTKSSSMPLSRVSKTTSKKIKPNKETNELHVV